MDDVRGGAGDLAAERRALGEMVGVVRLEDRAVLVATGADRVEFLQGMLTNDVARLGAGEACPALLLTIQGRVTAAADVLCFDDALWLVVDAAVVDATLEALERLIVADDVEIVRDDGWGLLALVGPQAARPLGDVPAPAPWHHGVATIDGVRAHLLRGAPLGDDDLTLVVPAAAAARVHAALVAGGARPCGAAAYEARRIALGVPRVGVDMGADTLAIEMPVATRISDRKGCYLGQEVVARGTSRGQVNRRLCGLVFAGEPPAAGAVLVAEGREVGRVTSVAHPPVVPTSIGLGLVRRERWDVGTILEVAGRPGTTARVAAWPLA